MVCPLSVVYGDVPHLCSNGSVVVSSELDRYTAAALLACSAIANVGSSVASLQRPGAAQPHQVLAEFLLEKQATKGYAGFWDANITAYLADGKATVASIACEAGVSKHSYYKADDAVRSKKALKSFVIVDDANAAGACNRSQLISQFGAPESEEKVNKWSVLFYPRDVGENIATEGITGYGKAWTPLIL